MYFKRQNLPARVVPFVFLLLYSVMFLITTVNCSFFGFPPVLWSGVQGTGYSVLFVESGSEFIGDFY